MPSNTTAFIIMTGMVLFGATVMTILSELAGHYKHDDRNGLPDSIGVAFMCIGYTVGDITLLIGN